MTDPGSRFVLGVAGPPGAGKSTLAGRVVAALGADAVLVPMDGFHRRQSELVERGLDDRKGAPDTFDVEAFVDVLRRVRAAGANPIEAPGFDRVRDDPVPGAVVVLPSHRIVVTEGNYLLVRTGGWERVGELLDECWYVDVDPAVRVPRLIARHVEFGRAPADAEAWVLRSDEANARVVEATRGDADRVVTIGDDADRLASAIRMSIDQTR